MSDTVSVPSEGPVASIEPVVSPPNPVHSETPAAEKVAPEPKPAETKPSTREALLKAAETVAKDEKAPAKPVDKAETAPVKDDKGRFAPKDPQAAAQKPGEASPAPVTPETAAKPSAPASDAPARFSPDAKAAWATAPEPVKAEVNRAIRELEEGHQKYRESADRYEKVREFDELARKNGREGVHESLKQVVELENAFQRSPIEGFQKVADHFGLSLRAVAAHVLGQDPQAQATQQDQTIQQLRSELQEIKASVGTITRSAEEQKQTQVLSKVQEFAQSNPRFEELSEDIGFFISSGRTSDLAEAYKLAERLNPAPAAPAATPVVPAPDLTAQTQKGSKSITGAPSSGSDPASRVPASSIKESLRRAMNAAS